jgi:hypothetical protein
MRIFGAAALLSFCVLVGCGAWYLTITSGNGPDRSVDFRPLVPMLTAAAALAFIWLVAGIAWIVRLAVRHRDAPSDEL